MTKNRSRRRIPLRRKLLYSLLVLTAFLVFTEAILYLCGVQPASATEDLFIGFQPGEKLFVKAGEVYVTNELKLSFFNQSQFSAKKPATTVRIFSLGGSTTYGHPYTHKASYNAWLQARLQATNPERTWEVINCGGISYASYRLANLADELAAYDPDVVIVYTGHNEFLEERTYGDVRERSHLVGKSIEYASKLRSFAVIYDMLQAPPTPTEAGGASMLAPEVDTILERFGPESYQRDDALHARIVQHYRDSLERIVTIARGAGAHVVLVRPACNLRDFSPFHSQHNDLGMADERLYSRKLDHALDAVSAGESEEALRYFTEAEQIDRRYAAGLYHHASALLAAGQADKAHEYFLRAKDEDVCPLRAITSIDQQMLVVAEELQVPIVDFPAILEERCRSELGHGIVGAESFLDHVHPDLDAHRALGLALYDEIVNLLDEPRRPLTAEQLAKLDQQVSGAISPYDKGMAQHALAMTLSWAGKTREALPIIEMAAQALPEDSEVAYEHAHILDKLGRNEEALARFQESLRLNPANSLARARLGMIRYAQQDYVQAADYLSRAIQDTPDRAPISVRIGMRLSLADCLKRLGEEQKAQSLIEESLAIDPHSNAAQQALKDLLP